ncbi:MAG: transporter [Acidimicrobiales bacterium]|nr:transporter [Acidimicrobiales bacterium]
MREAGQARPMDRSKSATHRFEAFGNRNFRLYFVGQTISSVGSWSQSLAVIWLVLEITNRSDRLGIAMALQFLPMLVLGPPAGVLADKLDNRRLLLATSTASGLLALTFGVVVATGHLTIWWIYALTMLLGVVLAVERPTMQAILFQLVGPELLPSAVAANSTINSVSRLVGPALAGALIATVGVETCFLINAASYVVVIGALLALRSSELVDRPLIGRAKGRLREGFAYVRTHPDVGRPLLVMVVVGTVALNFPTTFPSMVRFGFHRGAGSVGTAMSVSAIGSIIGGIYIAGVNPHPRRTLAIVLVGFAAACLALSITPGFWPFVAMSILLGFASASFQSVNTVVLQRATEPSMQGRVMALHQMAWFGSTPIGAVLMGWVIQVSSPRVPFALGGLSALLCAVAVVGYRRSARADAPEPQDRRAAGPALAT